VIGFSWWNAGFRNDPVDPNGYSDMRVQSSASLAAVLRRHIGANPAVLANARVAGNWKYAARPLEPRWPLPR
jgi:hypothetical protein